MMAMMEGRGVSGMKRQQIRIGRSTRSAALARGTASRGAAKFVGDAAFRIRSLDSSFLFGQSLQSPLSDPAPYSISLDRSLRPKEHQALLWRTVHRVELTHNPVSSRAGLPGIGQDDQLKARRATAEGSMNMASVAVKGK